MSVGEAALDLVPAVVRDAATVDSRYAVFTVDPYYPVLGTARKVTDITALVSPVISVSGLRQIETFPSAEDETIDSQARWLPQPARYPANLQWFPFSVAGDVDELVEGGVTWAELAIDTFSDVSTSPWLTFSGLSNVVSGALGDLSWYASSGAPPRIVENYTYFRQSQPVTAAVMSIRPGQYLYSDTLTLETSRLTLAMAAVLRAPVRDWYTVMEVASRSDTQGPVSIRYHREGVVVLWCDGALAEIPLVTGLSRPNQPVIVALTVDFDTLNISMTAVDTSVHTAAARLSSRPALQPRLYLGRSTSLGANASMDILEFNLWSREFSAGELASRVAQLDRAYGVST